MGTQSLGSIWKGRAWDDGNPIPRVTLPDGSLAEAMASMGYGWNATLSAFQKLTVDNATGALNVYVAGQAGGGSAVSIADGADVAQGTTTDLSSANTVVGILKAIKAALTGTLTTTTSWAAAQHVIVDSAPSTAVTGPLTDTQLRATPVPVSGTVTATTGGLTDTQLRASAVPVSATQLPAALAAGGGMKVEGVAGGVAQPVSGPLTDAQLRAAVVPIGDGAGSLTVDAPVGTPVFSRLSDGAAALVGQKAMAASLPVVVSSDQATFPVTATGPTLTKGTQAATGYSIQELKDAGRNVTNYFMAAAVALTNAEVMQSLTGYKGGAAVGATATPAVVTAGKTYRIERVTITFLAASAIGGALIRLRALSSGVALIGSPLVMNWHVGIPAIFTAGAEIVYSFDYPDGLEFAAGFGIAIGAIGEGADGVTGTAVGKILVSIEGYEY